VSVVVQEVGILVDQFQTMIDMVEVLSLVSSVLLGRQLCEGSLRLLDEVVEF
jgi:hypothetical protein